MSSGTEESCGLDGLLTGLSSRKNNRKLKLNFLLLDDTELVSKFNH